MLPFFKALESWLSEAEDKAGLRINPWHVFFLALAMLLCLAVFLPGGLAFAWSIALYLAPLWLPILILGGAWEVWVVLIRSEFIAKQKVILLEIKPPRNLVKTPLAMEAVLSGMHHGPGEGNWYAKYILGKVRPWWSLEIASIDGQVHFFIWTWIGFRRLIEAQLYSQYPGVQVLEVQDYTRTISGRPAEWSVWGCNFVHTDKEDPVPIKTYVDYGLDKVQKEPEQVDPIANLIEFLGTMKKGEQLWLQFVIRTHKGEKYNKLTKDGKPFTWKNAAKDLVNKIREETRDVYEDPVTKKKQLGFPNPTKGQLDKIAAIERNVAKLAFDVGIRGVYLAKDGKFDPIVITGLTGVFKQFSSEGWNGFKPSAGMTAFNDYPWEIGAEKAKNATREAIVESYRRRQFFHIPFQENYVVMSTEELATIYHIPSRAVESPGLERIQSATSEAPTNLPT